MFDSTEWEKMEAGLQHAGGKCILNSTNYEDGEPRFTKVVELAQEYGAAVVVGTIDEEGMARTADGKFKIARRAYEQATRRTRLPRRTTSSSTRWRCPSPPASRKTAATPLETIEGIRRIKAELPGCFTILGVSNISFGLNPASRVVLNSVFLHDAVEAGLDAAIVNASARSCRSTASASASARSRASSSTTSDEFDGDVCTYDPLTEFTKLFEGVKAKSDEEGRRERCRSKSGSSTTSSTARRSGSKTNLKTRARKLSARSTSSTTSCSTA